MTDNPLDPPCGSTWAEWKLECTLPVEHGGPHLAAAGGMIGYWGGRVNHVERADRMPFLASLL